MPSPAPIPRALAYDSRSSAFTRTCDVTDFAGCSSVADWQQAIARNAFAAWLGAAPVLYPCHVVNWSGCTFTAPITPIRATDPYPPESPILAAVFGLSVLDRIDAPQHFLRQAAARLIPGGLIVCTYAYWDASGPDVAVGHEVRRRIYDRRAIERLIDDLRRVGLTVFGRIDWRYRGDALGDHTLASLALITEKGSDR